MGTNIFAQAATMLRKQSIDDDIDGFVDFMGHCQAGYCYKTISEIPSEIFCPNCSYADTCAINRAIVVYLVN